MTTAVKFWLGLSLLELKKRNKFLAQQKLESFEALATLKPHWHQLKSYLEIKQQKLIDETLEWAQQPDNYLIPFTSANYPALLKQIPDPPLLLYFKGDIGCLVQSKLAIVGARKATPIGRENAFRFARDLSNQGLVITSGLALGIDTWAHKGALAADSATIAVLGHGLDQVYPASNRNLANKILQTGGGLVSEYALRTPPLPAYFPQRNRIISGLSLGVLVVEAQERSGSLVTARLAVLQNREVFAIPGSIHNQNMRGCHHLIQAGAKLVASIDDVMQELPLRHQVQAAKIKKIATKLQNISAEGRKILNVLDYDTPSSIDDICQRSGLLAAKITSQLLELELRQLIMAAPGGYLRAAI